MARDHDDEATPEVIEVSGVGEALSGLPYAGQDAVIDDGTSVSFTIAGSAGGGVEMGLPGAPAWSAEAGLVAIDRRLVDRAPRPWPPPPGTFTLRPAVGDDLVETARRHRVALVDAAAFDDALAGHVVRLAASGILCAWSGAPPEGGGLHPRLVDALAVDPAAAEDDIVWAAALAEQARAVWLHHDLQVWWDRDGGSWAPAIRPLPVPSVSVLLASKRPEMVPAALARIAAQQTVRPEVVVGLHTADSEAEGPVVAEMGRLGLEGEALRFDPSIPLGAVLDVSAEAASGTYVTKWDDDDLYGPRHLEDLVVAARHSRADLVGKRAEFMHFESWGETVARTMRGAEKRTGNVAGATLFTRRDLLLAVGGFPPLPKSVDFHLRRRYRSMGLSIYRTHGFGFVLVRRGGDHTWEVDEEKLRTKVVRTWDGVPAIADAS